jgi:hypothetical protein
MSHTPGADLAELAQIREWITHGIILDLDSAPAAADFENTYTVQLHTEAVRARLQEYVRFQAVIPLPDDHPLPFGIQPLHAIVKPDKKLRLVIDLSRNLNSNLHYESFSYATVIDAAEASWKNCWYGKLDLSNCFLSFPLHPSAYPHFAFRFEDQLYQFVRMPFGLSSAPHICTLLLSVVAFELQRLQLSDTPLTRFLDDFLFIKSTRATSSSALGTAQATFKAFGLVVNDDKTEGPAQRLAFLGILFDSVNQTLSCTPERVSELLTLLRATLHSRHVRLSTLNTLIGKLSFAAAVLPGARPFMRRMLDLRNGHQQRHPQRIRGHDSTPPLNRHARFAESHAPVHMDSGFSADTLHWMRHLHLWNGM